MNVTGTWKCDCLFKLQGKPIGNGEGQILKVICGSYNHEITKTLVGHPYADRLKPNEHSMIVDMTKSLVKLTTYYLF